MTEDDKLALRYQGTPIARAVVQALPGIGGPLDTLLAWRGSYLQQQRINQLLEELQRSFAALDSAAVQYADFETEEGADLLMAALRAAARHRSTQRIRALADVLVNRSRGFGEWAEAEDAVRVIDDLADLDLALLLRSSEFYVPSGSFSGGQTVAILPSQIEIRDEWPESERPKKLVDEFPDVPVTQLRLACMRLMTCGLVVDEGMNRLGLGAGEYFRFTDTAEWLMTWFAVDRFTDL